MHVDRDNMSAKIWLDPVVSLAENHGYSRRELREIERIATENLEKLRSKRTPRLKAGALSLNPKVRDHWQVYNCPVSPKAVA
jgi:hypothetical protein